MRHVVTIAFFLAAVAAYWASSWMGLAALFFLAGMLCEGVVWFRLLRRDKTPPRT